MQVCAADDNTMKGLLNAYPNLTWLRLHSRARVELGLARRTLGLTDRGCRALGALPLEYLAMQGMESISENELVRTVIGLPALIGLEITSCSSLTDVALVKITKVHRSLDSLQLIYSEISSSGLEPALRRSEKLKTLTLNNCKKINDKAMNAIGSHCGMCLRSLSIARCTSIGDQGIVSVSTTCRFLQHLNCSGVVGMTDAGFKAICCELSSLTDLNISRCKITEDGLLMLADLPRLVMLDASGCKGVSSKSISGVLPKLLELEALSVSSCEKFNDEVHNMRISFTVVVTPHVVCLMLGYVSTI